MTVKRFSRVLVPCLAVLCALDCAAVEPGGSVPDRRLAGVRQIKPQRGARKPFGTRFRRHSRRKTHPLPASAAPTPDEEELHPQASDPLERLNRGTFALNHQLYRFVFKPLSRVTTFLLPEPVLDAVGNVFENLKAPVRISASLFQGKGRRAAQEAGKLLVNSTAGVGGLWKASDRVDGLKNIPEEDFGQTFGVWGIKPGPYIVVPVLGPRSLRDVAGLGVDVCASPQTWVGAGNLNVWATAADNLQRNPDRMQMYDDATKDALDPYVAVREGYSSYRQSAVRR